MYVWAVEGCYLWGGGGGIAVDSLPVINLRPSSFYLQPPPSIHIPLHSPAHFPTYLFRGFAFSLPLVQKEFQRNLEWSTGPQNRIHRLCPKINRFCELFLSIKLFSVISNVPIHTLHADRWWLHNTLVANLICSISFHGNYFYGNHYHKWNIVMGIVISWEIFLWELLSCGNCY